MRIVLFPLLLLLPLAFDAAAAEIIVRTNDGQTIQGEHLGTVDKKVKLRTKYGEISIPEKSIVTISAAPVSEKPAEEEVKEPVAKVEPKEPREPAVADDLRFELVKPPNVLSLVAARAGAPVEPTKSQQQELHRAIRNFGDSSDSSRNKIIRTLQTYGPVAYPYIDAAYNETGEIDDRVDLLRAVAVPGRPFSTPIIANTHKRAMTLMARVADEPPELPPEYISRRDRDRPRGKAEYVKDAAANVLALEGYASTAGGPFNALYLLQVYIDRYTNEKVDPLLVNAARDAVRLAETAADANKSKSAWTGPDKILVAEQVFPWMFKDNADMKTIATELLKKLLPTGHPKWDATQTEWVTWWQSAKEKLTK